MSVLHICICECIWFASLLALPSKYLTTLICFCPRAFRFFVFYSVIHSQACKWYSVYASIISLKCVSKEEQETLESHILRLSGCSQIPLAYSTVACKQNSNHINSWWWMQSQSLRLLTPSSHWHDWSHKKTSLNTFFLRLRRTIGENFN
jgi:hypothetical protein